jgi:hypothetical protein
VQDQTASFRELTRGPARVCVVQLTGKAAQASALVEQMARTGASLAASCVMTELGPTTTVTIGATAGSKE